MPCPGATSRTRRRVPAGFQLHPPTRRFQRHGIILIADRLEPGEGGPAPFRGGENRPGEKAIPYSDASRGKMLVN
jgi:hypothetical protein